jgi:hypothetical protein
MSGSSVFASPPDIGLPMLGSSVFAPLPDIELPMPGSSVFAPSPDIGLPTYDLLALVHQVFAEPDLAPPT